MADFIDHFDKEFGPRLGVRMPTFRAVMREAQLRLAKTVVETGCIRKANNWEGDGQSTVIFKSYSNFSHGNLTSVDISKEACELANKILPSHTVHCQDSVKFLSGWTSVIDLLYLDSYDLDTQDEHPAALHCLFEFCAARPHLKPGSIVCIDDSPIAAGWVVTGKGRFVAQYMKQLGINPFTWGYQIAWIMP